MKRLFICLLATSAIFANGVLTGNCVINFNDVPMAEFVRFVSKISKTNFIFNEKELSYPINVVSGQAVNSEQVLDLLLHLLNDNGQIIEEKNGYYHIKNIPLPEPAPKMTIIETPPPPPPSDKFHVYKLQYHDGAEILDAVKQIGHQIQGQPGTSAGLLAAVGSIQWVKATNSLLFSGSSNAVDRLCTLIDTLDVPLRQVFIEVLVVETSTRNAVEFGVDWAGGGKFGKIDLGIGEIGGDGKGRSLASAVQNGRAGGAANTPMGRGFDLSVIGDIILHKGKTFFTLGTLVSALESDRGSKVLLNQKIITQDNKASTVFMGENIPFTGSVVQTVGNAQQTTANIEYKDVGVTLHIKPRLGKQDVITLEITEEISQAEANRFSQGSSSDGILTTKTNMTTSAHVPDQSFLVLSGMTKNTEATQKTGVPVLGKLPLVGRLFSKDAKRDDKKALLIFVRPQIINSIDDFNRITHEQQAVYTTISENPDIGNVMHLLQEDA